MVVDEDASVRRMMARVLESADYAAVSAENAGEALSRVEAEAPDLVVLDLNLPDQSSWTVFASLSRSRADLPVIGLTSWPDQSEQAHLRGVHSVMEKPLDIRRLLEMIGELLRGAQIERVSGREAWA
jgi:DNA-binding response OmpR family regulator